MKGIVFTLDAVFAIMIATIAISILLYFHYTSINQYSISVTSVNKLVYLLSATTLGNFTGSPLAAQMNNQYQGRQQTWPEFYQNNSNDASNPNGPYSDSLLLVFNSTGAIYPNSVIAGNGSIFFMENYPNSNTLLGHTSILGSIPSYSHSYPNAFFGTNPNYATVANSMTDITADLLYNNIPIYANKTALTAAGQWVNKNAIPSSGVVSSPMLAYDNIILVPIYTSSNAAETGIMGFYANNGTEAWTINAGGEVNSIAIVSGSIAAEVGNTVKIFSFQNYGTPFSIYDTAYPYMPTGMVVYDGSVHVANSALISGMSAYNGSLFYQSVSDYTSATGNVNTGAWKVYMPSYVGQALSNSQPVASNGNLYTLWSNNYLVDQNTNNGAIKWVLHIPYPGTLSPHMVLAYGELFVTVGNKLLGFGSCPGNSNMSLLSNMVSLYVNTLSSCTDALLNTANPSQNASITVNAIDSPGVVYFDFMYPYVMNFTGSHNNYVDIGNNSSLSPEAGSSGRMSLCTWYRINSLSGYNGPLIKGNAPPSSGNAWEYTLDQEGYVPGVYTHPSFTVWSPSGANIAFGEANAVTFNSMVNNWSFACFTYNYPGQKAYYYFNGRQYNASITSAYGPASAGTGSLIVGSGENHTDPTGKPGYSNVAVADLQIYNTILSYNQIKLLYSQGITASPVQSTGLVGWWPLGGDANDYSGNGHTGFPYNAISTYAGFISPGYLDAYDIEVSRAVVTAQGPSAIFYNAGGNTVYWINYPQNSTYPAGVYTWK